MSGMRKLPIGLRQTQDKNDEIDAEIIKLKTNYDAKEYQRQRKLAYPSLEELVVALYDTDDKAAIEKRRADVKAKYPKPE